MTLYRYCTALLAALGAIIAAPVSLAQTGILQTGTPQTGAARAAPATELTAATPEPVPAAEIPGLGTLLKQAGTGPVLVIFALNAGALGSAENPLAPASFEADPAVIAAGQDRMVKALEAARAEAIKPVRGLPLVVGMVNAEQLKTIVGSGLVAAVYEDRLSTPLLSRTVPHIGTNTLRAVGLRGQGQMVAVLDTGVMSDHSFFQDETALRSRVVREACFSSIVYGRSNSVCPGYIPYLEGPGATTPCWVISACYHGTHVTGIAAGDANAHAAFDGVAPEADIMSVQVFSLFGNSVATAYLSAYDSDILAGLAYVRTRRLAGDRIAAVNMSIGGGFASATCPSSPFETIIAALKRLDVATVIASGNDASNTYVSVMACPPSAIVVGSVSLGDSISAFSNTNPIVDLLAPGEDVRSSIARLATSYNTSSGTSMAAPHVAGAFALLRQQFPCTPIGVIENALKVSGVNVTHAPSGAVYKRVNLAGALHHLRFVERKYRCPVTNDPTVVTPGVSTKE